jgi:hypothetical protein
METTEKINIDIILKRAEEMKIKHKADAFIVRYVNFEEYTFVYSSSYIKPTVVESILELHSRCCNLLNTSGGRYIFISVSIFSNGEAHCKANVITNEAIKI